MTTDKKPTLSMTLFSTTIFCLLGLVGNYANIELFYSINFIFGGIFALWALFTLGLIPAIIVSIVATTYTYFLWGHPFGILIFTTEIIFIHYARYYVKDILIADVLFWILIGSPFGWFAYFDYLDYSYYDTLTILMKQAINGVFNALIAAILMDIYRYATKKRALLANHRPLFIHHLIKNTLVFLTIMAGIIPLIQHAHQLRALREQALYDYIQLVQSDVIRKFIVDRQQGISFSPERAQDYLEIMVHNITNNPYLGFSLTAIDESVNIQAGSVKFTPETGTLDPVLEDMMIWAPFGEMSNLNRWNLSEYIISSNLTIAGKDFILSTYHDTRQIITYLEENKLTALYNTIALIILSLMVSTLVSKMLLSPLQKLVKESQSFDVKNIKEGDYYFEPASFSEYKSLTDALETMAQETAQSYAQLTDFKETLEKRVQTRTAELERLSLVASQTNNSVIITNSEGKIEWVNEGFVHLTGYEAQEAIGQSPSTLLQGPSTDPRTIDHIKRAIKNGQDFHAEMINYTKSGRAYWIEVQCNPLRNQQGKLSGFIAIQNDITDRKLFEHELKEARNKAEKETLSKSQFLVSIGDEIRTPLNGILGLVQLLAQSNLGGSQQKIIETIEKSGHNLLLIINDILDLHKIEAGVFKLDNRPFNITKTFFHSIESFQSAAYEKGIELDYQSNLKEDHLLIGDQMRLTQILWNLISFTLKKARCGPISISFDVYDGQTAESDDISLTIKYFGYSLSENEQQLIFSPFKDDISNEGVLVNKELGLAVAKNIISKMNGNLTFNREFGDQNSLHLQLSLTRSDSLHLEANPNSDFGSGSTHSQNMKTHILIVDDNLINAAIAKSYLEMIDCDVVCLDDGQKAVDYCQQKLPDLIFMDLNMPILDGIEATKQIRLIADDFHIPIIGLSADIFEENKEKFMKAGLDRIISKPFDEIQLQQTVIDFCDQAPHSSDREKTVQSMQQRVEEDKLRKEAILASVMNDLDLDFNPNKATAKIVNPEKPKQDEPVIENSIMIGDEEQLATFVDQLGAERVLPLLRSIANNIQSYIAQIETAMEAQNHEDIRAACHAIKGASAQMYALRLSDIAKQMEFRGKNSEPIDDLYPVFLKTFEETKDWWHQKVTDLSTD